LTKKIQNTWNTSLVTDKFWYSSWCFQNQTWSWVYKWGFNLGYGRSHKSTGVLLCFGRFSCRIRWLALFLWSSTLILGKWKPHAWCYYIFAVVVIIQVYISFLNFQSDTDKFLYSGEKGHFNLRILVVILNAFICYCWVATH